MSIGCRQLQKVNLYSQCRCGHCTLYVLQAIKFFFTKVLRQLHVSVCIWVISLCVLGLQVIQVDLNIWTCKLRPIRMRLHTHIVCMAVAVDEIEKTWILWTIIFCISRAKCRISWPSRHRELLMESDGREQVRWALVFTIANSFKLLEFPFLIKLEVCLWLLKICLLSLS